MKIYRKDMNRRYFLGMASGALTTLPFLASAVQEKKSEVTPFSFAVIADPHCADGSKQGLEGLGNGVDKLMRCFAMMNALSETERPDFALIAGDIHPEALAPHLDKIHLPLHVVAGNHEGDPKTRGLLRSLFPKDFGAGNDIHDYYSFVHKGVRFIGVCDAGAGGEHVGQFCSELITPSGQCEWLERELAMPESKKVLFAHIPPALDGGDRNMFMSRNDSRWFLETVRKTPPELMVFGHLHHETEFYAVGDAQGINLRSCCWNFQNAPLGFLLVTVTSQCMETREIITGTAH